jgi:HK97 family phage portal protein
MFQSNGVLVKTTTTIWEGTPANWPANLQIGNHWSSYAELYRRQLWVNVVIDKRAKAAARLPFKVYERAAGGRKDAASTPFGQLMARPSKSIDPFLFWMWTLSTKDIQGEAFWLKVRDRGGRPVELLPIHPTKVIDETDDDGKTTWKIRLRSGDVTVQRRDLVHFREFNPDTLLRGMSKLEPLRSTLENEDGARRANSAMWRNGGRPSVYLQHPKTLANAEVARRLSSQWNEIHSGVDNWAKAAILEEGMTANAMPLNVEELQYIEARKLNREEVCAAFDMAPPVVHILDRATFSNITEQHRSMYRDTMGTVLGSLESTVEAEVRDGRYGADVPADFGEAFYGEFLLDEVLRGDFEARADALQKADYLTIAEKREIENRPFIPGTDYIFLNSASLPLGPDGLLVQPAAVAAEDGSASPDEIAVMLQKIYLAVGVVISPEEARAILNRAGAGLTGPAPAAAEKSVIDATCSLDHKALRSVMGRLSRAKSLSDVNPETLVSGMEEDAVAVLQHLVAAQLSGDTVDGLKNRLRSLTAGKEQ